jgi:hypothetical protein
MRFGTQQPRLHEKPSAHDNGHCFELFERRVHSWDGNAEKYLPAGALIDRPSQIFQQSNFKIQNLN